MGSMFLLGMLSAELLLNLLISGTSFVTYFGFEQHGHNIADAKKDDPLGLQHLALCHARYRPNDNAVEYGDNKNYLCRNRFNEYFDDAWVEQTWWADNCDCVIVQHKHPSRDVDYDDEDLAAPVLHANPRTTSTNETKRAATRGRLQASPSFSPPLTHHHHQRRGSERSTASQGLAGQLHCAMAAMADLYDEDKGPSLKSQQSCPGLRLKLAIEIFNY
ncbi:hypothetical protein ZEAMMB73_Zm00001d015573 [Zea mays]|uniref:Uncharacterized protein n=1 Tax=Zea mays TaxID=4577 RepID=A0A1D6H2S6_MAIZE|nr:hypothetical protein ZEAMMB73_Zm00001d015573 [Zea mays]